MRWTQRRGINAFIHLAIFLSSRHAQCVLGKSTLAFLSPRFPVFSPRRLIRSSHPRAPSISLPTCRTLHRRNVRASSGNTVIILSRQRRAALYPAFYSYFQQIYSTNPSGRSLRYNGLISHARCYGVTPLLRRPPRAALTCRANSSVNVRSVFSLPRLWLMRRLGRVLASR